MSVDAVEERIVIRRSVLAIVALGLLYGTARSQSAPTPPPVDATVRREVVTQAADVLRRRYVYPDVGDRAAETIQHRLASGAYGRVTDPAAFAARLTNDLAEVAHDKHLRVRARGLAPPADTALPTAPLVSELGVGRADRLPGNVGYLELTGFGPSEVFATPSDRALAALADTRALIIDLRRNGGGDPETVAYMIGHFVAGNTPVHTTDVVNRIASTRTFRTDSLFTKPTPIRYLGRPVYILTSSRTFSGGEEFAYDMQALKLATLVGEVTGGGANPGEGVPLGERFDINIPEGRALNPITHGNWEGRGVQPDLSAPSDDALSVTLARLGRPGAAGATVDALSTAHLFVPRTVRQPGSEAAVRRLIAEFRDGAPRYELMLKDVADANREFAPAFRADLERKGALQSVEFLKVDDFGLDDYAFKFAHGSGRCRITLAPDGRLAMFLLGFS